MLALSMPRQPVRGLEALQPDEAGLTRDIETPPADLVQQIRDKLSQ